MAPPSPPTSKKVLVPELTPGTVVILDNLATHKNAEAAKAMRDAGCWYFFLPPYSPDLNPIEMAFSKLKAHLRRIGARSFTEMFDAIAEVCDLYSPKSAGTTSSLPDRCSIPDDHIDPRRSAFFMARSVLGDIREGV
jgi:hypothetical protein